MFIRNRNNLPRTKFCFMPCSAQKQQKKYILLKGKKHGNVFWTTFSFGADYSDYEVLYQGNEVEEMTREWQKYYNFKF